MEKALLAEVVKKNDSIAGILRELKVRVLPWYYHTLKSRLDEDCIDYSHIQLGLSSNKNRKFESKPNKNAIPLNTILVKNSTYSSNSSLKKRLMKENLLGNSCAICNILPEWNGKKLVLQMDHINGIHNDNRLENLRLLCPNCHSQTETFSCKRNKKTII